MDMQDLERQLKTKIIQCLNLEDINPEDINRNEPLFIEGLGLDSVDALQIVVMLESAYGIKIKDAKKAKNILYSINSIATYILEEKDY